MIDFFHTFLSLRTGNWPVLFLRIPKSYLTKFWRFTTIGNMMLVYNGQSYCIVICAVQKHHLYEFQRKTKTERSSFYWCIPESDRLVGGHVPDSKWIHSWVAHRMRQIFYFDLSYVFSRLWRNGGRYPQRRCLTFIYEAEHCVLRKKVVPRSYISSFY